MNELVIGNKKYILLPRKEYERLRKTAALKVKPDETFTLKEARAFSRDLIRKWGNEK
jgi:hypothetical protein